MICLFYDLSGKQKDRQFKLKLQSGSELQANRSFKVLYHLQPTRVYISERDELAVYIYDSAIMIHVGP